MTLSSSDYGADYFANVYGAASKTGEPSQTWIDRARDRLLVKLAIDNSAKPLAQLDIVDVGCGYGWLLDTFAGAKSLTGSDISEHAIDMAKSRNPERTYAVADLLDGPPFPGTFDVILAVNLVEHLTDPARGVDNIQALCAPGSLVLVHLPVVDNKLGKWIYDRTYASDPTHIYRPTGKQVKALFEERGFTTVRESYLPHALPQVTRHLRLHPSYLAVFRSN